MDIVKLGENLVKNATTGEVFIIDITIIIDIYFHYHKVEIEMHNDFYNTLNNIYIYIYISH